MANHTPVVKLKNGVRVANFSSPHSFQFDDGTILPACAAEVSTALSLQVKESTLPHPKLSNVIDVCILYKMSEPVHARLLELCAREDIDIVLVPLPVLEVLRTQNIKDEEAFFYKVRGCRVVDRVKKIVSSTRFCL